MFCKYCGSRIPQAATMCASCGANINLNDGGQSFFNDNELDEWNSLSYEPIHAKVPKTEMRDRSATWRPGAKSEARMEVRSASMPLSEASSDFESDLSRPRAKNTTMRSRKKKKKAFFDISDLSPNNKLILFCIGGALSVVLIVVAIVAAVINKDKMSEEDTPINTLTTQSPMPTNPISDKTAQSNDKTVIDGLKIVLDQKVIEVDVPSYIISGNLYIPCKYFLKAKGFNDGKPVENGEDRKVRFENSNTKEIVEVQVGTNAIWINKGNGQIEPGQLLYNSFEQSEILYVPARSFLEKMGCSEINYHNVEKQLDIIE